MQSFTPSSVSDLLSLASGLSYKDSHEKRTTARMTQSA